ncbi:MAG: type IV pili methyl-accepting chemotaxis transducer N-terminal domain-containing protein [Pseudomonadota bacterium]
MNNGKIAFSRRSFGLGMAAIAAAGAVTSRSTVARAASGGDGSFAAATHRVTLAEEQAVITQRIPMCAGFIKLNVEPSRFLKNLEDEATKFDKVLKGLRHGDAELDLEAEPSGEVLEALSAVEAVWPAMKATVDKILANGAVDDADFANLARSDSALLFMCENVEKRLVSVYGDTAQHLGVLIAVELSVRQAMLTQKMAKEVTKIALEVKPEENRKILGETITLFENSLEALLGGVEALKLPAPPEHIKLALLEERSRWSDLGPAMRGIAEGGEAGLLELYSIASQEEALLEAARHIEHMYEEMGAHG